MTANAFRERLAAANLTAEEFADIVQVDPKTVQRWITGRAVPQRRHRAKVARALDAASEDLWPDPTPGASSDGSSDGASAAREITAAWTDRGDENPPGLAGLLERPVGPVDLLDPRGELLRSGELIERLLDVVAANVPVRVAANQVTDQIRPLADADIEVRVVDATPAPAPAVMRIGERMFAIVYLATPPHIVLQLQRQVDRGVFDRFVGLFDEAWDGTTVRLRTLEQFDAYLASSPTSLNDPPTGVPTAAVSERPEALVDSEATVQASPRRWPGRRST